ncbi:MAG: YdcF family protein [Pseudomonadota bacterium]
MADLDLLPAKLLSLLARPDFWLWLGLLTVMVALFIRWYGLAKWVTLSLVITVTMVGFIPVGSVWLVPLESRFPANPEIAQTPSAIVVLGGGEDPAPSATWNAMATNDAGDRFTHAMRRAVEFPTVPVLFTGGGFDPLGNPLFAGSAERVGTMLVGMGLDAGRVHIADEARNTAEHPLDLDELFTRLGIEPSAEAPLLLITSAFHMARSVGVLCNAGFAPIIPDPTDFRTAPGQGWQHALGWSYAGNLTNLQVAIREWVGLVVYRFRGYTPALLPENC